MWKEQFSSLLFRKPQNQHYFLKRKDNKSYYLKEGQRMFVVFNTLVLSPTFLTNKPSQWDAVWIKHRTLSSVSQSKWLLPTATKLGQGNIFTSVCQEFCPQGGRVSASVHAGIHPLPPSPQEQTPSGADPPGQTPPGEQTPPREADCSIRSTSGRYASYWNAFLFETIFGWNSPHDEKWNTSFKISFRNTNSTNECLYS